MEFADRQRFHEGAHLRRDDEFAVGFSMGGRELREELVVADPGGGVEAGFGLDLFAQSAEVRAEAETLLQQADRPLCESWNERMWADGEPIDPSHTINQAVNGGSPGKPWSNSTRARVLSIIDCPESSPRFRSVPG
jgi:hypothetical protein